MATNEDTLIEPTENDPSQTDHAEEQQDATSQTESGQANTGQDGNGQEEEAQSLTLEVTVESPSACERHVTVLISREDVDRYFNEAIDELMPKASVPGFRPGRAPRKLVESRFRQDVTDQVKGSLLLDTINQVVEEQEFSAISEPNFDFEAVTVPNEGPMTFEFDIEVRPEFDMPDWKELKLEKPTRNVTGEDVDHQIERMLASKAHIVPFDGSAEKGNYVVANVTTRHEGKVVARQEELSLRVRPTLSFRDCRIEGFDTLIVGAKEGDKKEAQTQLGNTATNRELRGANLTVEFEVLEVKKLELPELNRETLSLLGEFGDEGELRDAVESSLDRQLAYVQQQKVRQQITDMLTESADWELPPDLLKRQSGRELERAVLELEASGFDEEYIQAHENEIRQNAEASTEKALKEHFILERIAEQEEIEANEEEMEGELALIAMQRNESPRRIRARLEKSGGMDALRNQVIERKVLQQIESHAKFKEVKFEGLDYNVEAVDTAIGGGANDAQIPEAKHAPDGQSLRRPVDRS